MEPSADLCYRALQTRDARFDGRFFTGVVTTGIYCRPICPARTPLRKNVRFYACAAAAEEAGFRACARCRPDTAPGSPAWRGTSGTVSRGLRLIAEGALDEEGVDHLAARLGVGSRHLRRLFMEHLGAPPLAVAQTRRVHFARKLLDGTQMPIADVALASGFASVRRFNAAFQKAFHLTPTEARRKARGRNIADEAGGIELRLPYRPPYDWPALLSFLRARATPGVEAVDANSYRRTIAVDGVTGTIAVRPSPTRHEMLLTIQVPEPKHFIQIAEAVRKLLDLEADPLDICAHLGRDRSSPVAHGHIGLRVPGAWDGFELAVRAVLGQQVSVKGATTLAGRLAAEFGERLTDPQQHGLHLLFPTPERLARADLTKVGLPGARAAAIRGLAAETAAGRIRFDSSCDAAETAERLCRVPGIGAWTAQYIAMRALRDPDAFPASDLILRRAASSGSRVISAKELEARAEAWRPWRAYAALHLWTGYQTSLATATKPARKPTLRPAARKQRAYAEV